MKNTQTNHNAMIKKQKGMTFIGLLFMLALIGSWVFIGFQVIPAFMEFSSVKKVIQRIANEPDLNSMTKAQISEEFDKNASTSYVTVVTSKDLTFTKGADGKQVVTIEYQVVKPIALGISALMDFKASTEK